MKYTISFFTVIVLAMTMPQMACAYDFSAVAPSGQTLYYNIVAGGVEVTRPSSFYYGYTMPEGTLIIPSTVNNGANSYEVTAIGESAFSNCTNLTSVTIPSTVKIIRNDAFYSCIGLETILLPDSLQTIESGAFAFCRRLVNFELPAKIKTIGDYALSGINNVVYNGDSNLYNSWCGCFAGDAKMINGYIENSIVYYDSTKTEIRGFQGVIYNLIIPNSVLYIHSSAFSHCDSLISITIPPSVIGIEDMAFENIYNANVYYLGTMTDWCNINFGPMHESNPASHSTLYINNNAVTDIVIPEGVTTIKTNTFNGIGTSVIFSSTVTTIADGAFVGSNITSLTIPSTIQTVGVGAFKECYHLQNVLFEGANTTIGNEAFYYCPNLRKVKLPDSLTIIHYYTFYDCTSLDSLEIPSTLRIVEGDLYNGSFYGCDSLKTLFYNADSCTTPLYISYSSNHSNNGHQSPTKTIHIGENVKYIPENAFSQFDQLTTIYANPLTAPTLGDNVFNSTMMTDVDIYIPCGTFDNYHNNWGNYNYQEPIVNFSVTANVNEDEWGQIVYENDRFGNEVWCDSSVHITATTNYGYHFAFWSDTDTNNPRIIMLTKDTIITAIFDRNNYNVTGLTEDSIMGIVTGSGSALYLDSLTLTPIPHYGYHFTEWNDGNTDKPRTIEVSTDSSFTALFDLNQYSITLDIDSNIHGTVTGGGLFYYQSEQIITAESNYGYHFTSWSDGDTCNPRIITLTSDTAFVALFEKDRYIISVISEDTTKGYVTGNDTVLFLDSITIAATPNYGYHFARWSDGETSNPRTLQITSNQSYTAYFDFNEYTVTVGADSSIHGTVTGAGTFNYLSLQSISATPAHGYHFVAWSDGDTSNPRIITITQDTVLIALFAKNTYILTVESLDTATGTVVGTGTYEYLDTVTIEATATEHHHFLQWNDGISENPRRYIITEDALLTATFAIDTHHVSVESCNIAYGNVSGGGDFEYGTPATLTATAYSGYRFVCWSNGDTHNPYTFAVLQDTSLTALFENESQEGIGDVEAVNAKVYSHSGQIVVEGAEGHAVTLYDINGRLLATRQEEFAPLHFDVPASGTYMLRIGNLPARKVVVIR